MDNGYDKYKDVFRELFAANGVPLRPCGLVRLTRVTSSELRASNRMLRRASRKKGENIQAAVIGYEDYIIDIISTLYYS